MVLGLFSTDVGSDSLFGGASLADALGTLCATGGVTDTGVHENESLMVEVPPANGPEVFRRVVADFFCVWCVVCCRLLIVGLVFIGLVILMLCRFVVSVLTCR